MVQRREQLAFRQVAVGTENDYGARGDTAFETLRVLKRIGFGHDFQSTIAGYPQVVSKQLLAIVEDLFFAVKIEGAAKGAGVALQFAKTEASALAAAPTAELILLDLNCKGIDVLDLLARLPGDKVIGFVSHVQTELRQAAAAAGCGRVMARSAFSDQLPAILQSFQNGSSGTGV